MPSQTNITTADRRAFDALTQGGDGFALFSCFVDGAPSSAIVNVAQDDKGEFIITPLFVAVTPRMDIADHDGTRPSEHGAVSLPLAAAQAAIALGLASGVASLMAWAQGLIGGVL